MTRLGGARHLVLFGCWVVCAADDYAQLIDRADSLLDRDPASSAGLYRRALQLRPQSGHAWANLGMALHTMGQLGAAVEAFYQAASATDSYDDWVSSLLSETL